MDHKQIDQFDLIDRYLMGKLLADESASFEEHFVDCPDCIARLQTTKNFMQDLRLVAEQVAQREPHRPRSTFWQGVKNLFPKPLVWAVGCLLIAVAGTFFVIAYTLRLQDEANQAKSLSEQWQRRYEDEHQSARTADRMHQETEMRQAEQLRALEEKLKEEEAQRAKMAAESSRRLPSAGNLPIFILNSVRSGEPNRTESVNRINLPRSAAIFAFSITLEGETRFETCRIKIFDDRQRLIMEELVPIRQGALSVWLKPGLFHPGHHNLIVESNDKEGRRGVVGYYPFLIVKTP
jgi:hypothetical protein